MKEIKEYLGGADWINHFVLKIRDINASDSEYEYVDGKLISLTENGIYKFLGGYDGEVV